MRDISILVVQWFCIVQVHACTLTVQVKQWPSYTIQLQLRQWMLTVQMPTNATLDHHQLPLRCS